MNTNWKTYNVTFNARQHINSRKARSAWDRGVIAYANELIDNLEESTDPGDCLEELMLSGAQDWREYSEGGYSLIYDRDIAERLCSPSELRRSRYGDRRPNSYESWIDVQSRALYQAAKLVADAINTVR